MESMQEPPRPRVAWPIPAAFSALAVTSLATAGIHFAVLGEHFTMAPLLAAPDPRGSRRCGRSASWSHPPADCSRSAWS